MDKARLALIGAGVIGKRHLEAIASVAHVELTGIVDPFQGARQIAEQHGVPIFADTGDMLDHCQPDGVIVATPTEHHLVPTLESLEFGAHVLVEKPIMATVEEARKTAAKADAVGRHVLVGHHRRHYALVNQAHNIVRQGQLGQLVGVVGHWNLRKHADYYLPDWRKKWQAGPILTNLIHDMDLLRYIAGDIVSINAETSNAVMGFEKEDAAALVLKFKNGALGTFLLSDQSHSPWGWEQATGENMSVPRTGRNAIRFMGTEGSLEFPNLKIWNSEGTPDWRAPLESNDMAETLEDAYINQINHFSDVIKGITAPCISAHDATDTLRATLAVYDAAESGQRVML